MGTRWYGGWSGSRLIEAVLAGLVVVANPVPAPGQVDAQVTFTRDIAPILQRSCQSCHRPGPGGGGADVAPDV